MLIIRKVCGLLHGQFANGVAGFHDIDAFRHVRQVHTVGMGGVHQQSVGIIYLDVGSFVQHHAVALEEDAGLRGYGFLDVHRAVGRSGHANAVDVNRVGSSRLEISVDRFVAFEGITSIVIG